MSHKQRVKKGQQIDGWLNFYKPEGMNSTTAVAKLKRFYDAKKCGHAGTLDPLATGVLPLAFGEATKTVQFMMDADKDYDFTVQFGSATNTDDTEGEVTQTSDKTPTQAEIEAELSSFIGQIEQLPPQFSAIKIKGEAAYSIARRGDTAEIKPRPVVIHELDLLDYDADTRVAKFSARVGKGTYIRAIARDLGEQLGCYGHITRLCRQRVGPFQAEQAIYVEQLDNEPEGMQQDPRTWLLPTGVVLADIPAYQATFNEVTQLQNGKRFKRIHLQPGVMRVVDPRGEVRSLVEIKPDGWVEVVRNLN